MDSCIILLVALVIASSYLYNIKWFSPATQQLLYVFAGILLIITLKTHYESQENFENSANAPNNNGLPVADNAADTPKQDWSQIQSVTKDNFQGLKQIIAYLKGLDETDLEKEEAQRLLGELSSQFGKFDSSKLDYQLSQITTLLTNLQNVSNITPTPEADENAEDNILENRSIKESQFLQDIEIKGLEKELAELQMLYTGYLDKEAKKDFKKIPVYSSCVMEANGSTSTCNPKVNDFGFESPEEMKRKKALASGSINQDPSKTALNKLIKTISEGGVTVSMTGK